MKSAIRLGLLAAVAGALLMSTRPVQAAETRSAVAPGAASGISDVVTATAIGGYWIGPVQSVVTGGPGEVYVVGDVGNYCLGAFGDVNQILRIPTPSSALD